MSRVATLISLLLLLTIPRALSGQDPEPGPDPVSEPVVVSEKSPFAAGVIEWALPTAGYAYAGDWSRAIPSGIVRVAGFAMVVGQQFTIFGDPPPCEGTCIAGAILLAGGTLWGVLDAAATARRTNERLREEALSRVSISPVRGPDGTGMRIGLRLPVGG
jgi:hypothetical protein